MSEDENTPARFIWGPLDGQTRILRGNPPYYEVAVLPSRRYLLSDAGKAYNESIEKAWYRRGEYCNGYFNYYFRREVK